MTFIVGLKVISKATGESNGINSDNIALLLLNDTFPEVTSFPKVLPTDPMPEGTMLKCSTVGFSLFGRNITYPIVDPIKPMTFDIEGQLNISYCSSKWVYIL